MEISLPSSFQKRLFFIYCQNIPLFFLPFPSLSFATSVSKIKAEVLIFLEKRSPNQIPSLVPSSLTLNLLSDQPERDIYIYLFMD